MTDPRIESIAALAVGRGATVGTVESCTAGRVAHLLSRGEGASEWLAGGLVTYSREAKEVVLEMDATRVITAEAAATMAEAGERILGSDVTVSVTGVAGPEPEEGEPSGTVWLGVRAGGSTTTERFTTEGDPPEVVESAARRALDLVQAALDGLPGGHPASGQSGSGFRPGR
jgi:nicotinamide-nucleotide amidase